MKGMQSFGEISQTPEKKQFYNLRTNKINRKFIIGSCHIWVDTANLFSKRVELVSNP